MYRRTLATFISVLAVAALAAGCGGDDSDSLTRAEFVKQAQEMCERVSGETQAKLLAFVKEREKDGEGEKKLAKSDEAELVEEVIPPALNTKAEELEEIGAPEGEEEKYEALIEELQSNAETAETNSEVLVTEAAPFAQAEKLAKELGVPSCGAQ
jgi:hypothetical protein